MHFVNLPVEIIAQIAMTAGFRESVALGLTCKYLYRLLLGDECGRVWKDYSNTTFDRVCIDIPVETRVHRFDHFVFGEWSDFSKDKLAGRSRQDSAVNLSNSSERDDRGLTLFMQHESMNRRSELDFLGGMAFKFSSKERNLIQVTFFESPRHLPCYLQHWYKWKEERRVESPLGLAGQEFHHSCEQCSEYENRKFLADLFYFNRRVLKRIPLHGTPNQFDRLERALEDPRSPIVDSQESFSPIMVCGSYSSHPPISEDVCIDWSFDYTQSWTIRILVHDSNHFNPQNLTTKVAIDSKPLNETEIALFRRLVMPHCL